ncbi:MAG: 2-hydroxyacid dehydrogenase [Chloroflexota bacterium]
MKIVIPDDFPPVYAEEPAALDPLRAVGRVDVFGTRAADRDDLLLRLAGAEATINVRAYTVFDAALLDALPDLRLISILGTGTDNVDLASAAERGVVVTNTPGASTYSVAETAFALMLASARHLALADRKLRAGEWHHRKGVELHGKVLGVVGLGLIGQAMAQMGAGFGMRVLAWSYNNDPARARACGAEAVDLGTLLREADVVSLHLRASPQANGIIGRRELALMKPTAILVNTARGSLVDEAALAEALRGGRLFAAGLDAYQKEPLPDDSPLRGLDNVVLSPHAGWVTYEASRRLVQMPVDNILAYLAGAPRHVVNPAALAHRRQSSR